MDYVAKAQEASRRWRAEQGLPPRDDLSSVPSSLSKKEEGLQDGEKEKRGSTTETIDTTKEIERVSREGQDAKARTCHPTYAHPWPDEIPGLGRRRVGPFESCSGCGRGSWARYGGLVLCCQCAIVSS